ncbi:Reverse transcriptase Ty1/copia-type domain-containing protein [Fusarium sp. Ph1]|nr:Reverse transcriptase Ty1/copia-type domain-containing protein [Fusarium sp. Ph1]
MKQQSNLPGDLEPEIVRAAVYLLNRTPIHRSDGDGWKTPYERWWTWMRENVTQFSHIPENPKPDLRHLKAYGCIAYPMTTDALEHIKSNAPVDKTGPKAHIGYLVGYRASTQFLIWVPSLRKTEVIVSANVGFNEAVNYDPDREKDAEAAQEYTYDALREMTRINVEQVRDRHDYEVALGLGGDELDAQEGPPEACPEDPCGEVTRDGPSELEEEAPGDVFLTPPASNDGAGEPAMTEGAVSRDQLVGVPIREVQQLVTDDFNNDWNSLENEHSDPEPGPSVAEPNSSQREDSNDIPLESLPGLGGEGDTIIVATENDASQSPAAVTQQRARKPYDTSQGISADNIVTGRRSRQATKRAEEGQNQTRRRKGPNALVNAILARATQFRLHQKELPHAPKSYSEAMNSHYRDEWLEAIQTELEKLRLMEAYAAVSLQELEDRSQIELLALKWETRQYDVENAFINSVLDEEVYCRPPHGSGGEGYYWKLIKALYGLRRSPRLWFNTLSDFLKSLGFQQCKEDQCVFRCGNIIVFFFVDDIVMMYPKHAADEWEDIHKALMAAYKVKDLGELPRFHLNREGEGTRIPYAPGPASELVPSTGIADVKDIARYQAKIGSIGYAAVITRPDIAFHASKLAQFNLNPDDIHQRVSDQVIQYAYNTRRLAIHFSGAPEQRQLYCTADASYANDQETRKSTQGWVFQLFGGPVAWRSSRQHCVTLSSTEAELMALSAATKERIRINRLLKELRVNVRGPTVMWCDNQQTIGLVTKEADRLTTALRHCDIHNLWLRELREKGDLDVRWLPTDQMVADVLTKAKSSQEHQKAIKLLRLQSPPVSLGGGDEAFTRATI